MLKVFLLPIIPSWAPIVVVLSVWPDHANPVGHSLLDSMGEHWRNLCGQERTTGGNAWRQLRHGNRAVVLRNTDTRAVAVAIFIPELTIRALEAIVAHHVAHHAGHLAAGGRAHGATLSECLAAAVFTVRARSSSTASTTSHGTLGPKATHAANIDL